MTRTPFEGALPGTPLDNYCHPGKDKLRQQVNTWIRSGEFGAVPSAAPPGTTKDRSA